MRLTAQSFLRQRRAVCASVEHICRHLDETVQLADLADVAGVSRHHLDHLYRSKVKESPLATLRRLRLARALAQIRAGQTNLTRVAFDAGYQSSAAFTHAFVRHFGLPPSRVPALTGPAVGSPGLRITHMAATPVLALPYRGARHESLLAEEELAGRVKMGGAQCWRSWELLDTADPFGREPSQQVVIDYLVPRMYVPQRVAGVDEQALPGGLYAVFSVLGEQHAAHDLAYLQRRIAQETAFVAQTGGRVLRRDIKVSGYTPVPERHIEWWLPVLARD